MSFPIHSPDELIAAIRSDLPIAHTDLPRGTAELTPWLGNPFVRKCLAAYGAALPE